MRTFDVTYDYNRETFSSFLYDFLPDDFEPKEEEVFFDFKNIERGFKLGTCKSLNLDVFEFKTRPNRDARVTLTREAVTCMKKFGNPNALVAFYSSKSHNWRFSLITTDYTIEKGKIKTEYSNPKRFSFKLGYEAKAHTPTVMLFNKGKINEHLENGKTVPVLEDLKSRFALEVVSKEFFDEYKVFYEDFVQYITGNRYLPKAKEKTSIHKENKEIFEQFLKLADGDYDLACKYVRDYIKKMMGRLVFLEYLQKKGWLGVEQNGKWGDGDKNFLLSIFEESNSKDDFLDKVLEPLFFGMLNTPEDVRQLEFKHNRWNIKLLEQFKKVPYLNGGLFEKDELDKLNIVFPKEMFSNPECIDIQRVFAGVQKKYPYTESCGLLDFFARYNFTIDETDPTDMEIGVEPEMLGKIFENLLEDNKDKGAFYTPKEIVQYMCRESLIAYLGDNEKVRSLVIEHNADFNDLEKSKLIKKLKAVKVCDPAVGSGAFPMGILNELFACRVALGDDKKATEIKKQIVRENIYGVDIEKGAVDIARLRFWLAIIVDEKEPIPLPNLDYKIMQGNSLLESYEGIELSKLCEKVEGDLFDDADDISALIEYLKVYYDKHEEKNAIRDAIKASVLDLLKNRGISGKAFNELSKIDLHENNKFFLWHTWFNDVFNRPNDCNGFDIVIGNPPYISAPTQIANKYLSKQRDNLINSGKYKSLYQKWDLYIPFIELGTQLNCKNGITSMIVPFPLTNQLYAKFLRKMLVEENDMFELVDLNGTKIFENATVSNCIPFIKKAKTQGKSWISNIDDKFIINHVFEQNHKELVQDEKSYIWNVTQEKRKTNRHEDMHILGDYCYISKGMVLHSEEQLFTNEDLISETQDKIHCRKYLEAKDMDRYLINRVRYIEYDTDRVPAKVSRPTFRELYENDKLLFNCLGELKVMTDLGNKYICQQSIRVAVLWKDLHDVENKSITTSIKKFSLMTRENMEKLSKMVDLRYLLGILNSKYASILLTNLRGGDYHIVPEHIRNIPIPSATQKQQKPIIDLVDKIFAVKKADSSADTSKLEAEIDRLVYKLYSLTDEEIKTIEK